MFNHKVIEKRHIKFIYKVTYQCAPSKMPTAIQKIAAVGMEELQALHVVAKNVKGFPPRGLAQGGICTS